jgi:hypothetical protein
VHQRAGQRLRADLVEDPLVELGLDGTSWVKA